MAQKDWHQKCISFDRTLTHKWKPNRWMCLLTVIFFFSCDYNLNGVYFFNNKTLQFLSYSFNLPTDEEQQIEQVMNSRHRQILSKSSFEEKKQKIHKHTPLYLLKDFRKRTFFESKKDKRGNDVWNSTNSNTSIQWQIPQKKKKKKKMRRDR